MKPPLMYAWTEALRSGYPEQTDTRGGSRVHAASANFDFGQWNPRISLSAMGVLIVISDTTNITKHTGYSSSRAVRWLTGGKASSLHLDCDLSTRDHSLMEVCALNKGLTHPQIADLFEHFGMKERT